MTRGGRFASTPSGMLHIGNAFTAVASWLQMRQSNGQFVLRVEDIDTARSRADLAQKQLEDLRWLGLHWDPPVLRQSDRMSFYAGTLEHLHEAGVTYPCFCTRKQIRLEIEDAARAPHGPGHELSYPGTCRSLDRDEARYRIERGEPFAWRLDVAKANRLTGPLCWYDIRAGWTDANARRTTPTRFMPESYGRATRWIAGALMTARTFEPSRSASSSSAARVT